MKKKEFSKEELLQKAMRFCDYQERCTFDVLQRLRQWEASLADQQYVLSKLRDENLLDDERFANAFVRGKFRLKNWGAAKIRAALRQKQIAESIITEAIKNLPQEQVHKTLKLLLEKKNSQLKEPNPSKRKSKMAMFAMQKGYSGELVWKTIDEVLKG